MKTILFMKSIFIGCTFFLVMTGSVLNAQQDGNATGLANNQIGKTVPVAWDTFVRAETDKMFKLMLELAG